MNRLLIIASLGLISAAQPQAADGDDALFGLKWGMTISEARAKSKGLSKVRGEKNLETYKSAAVPKPLSDIESYMLTFADGKLVKVSAVGREISGDALGSTGKEKFEALRVALQGKYGKPTINHQSIGHSLYKERDEFYQCLAYSGCGLWVSAFEASDKSVIVELKGLSRGVGYIEITAESKPQWQNALDAFESRKASADRDAL